jgi:hypothetical protein
MTLARWEKVEQWIGANALIDGDFNNASLAAGLGIPTGTATDYIQAYLHEQNRHGSRTLYLLRRTGRTTGTIWHVGQRTSDARGLGKQTADDFQRRFHRCIKPALVRIEALNPRAATAAQTIMSMLNYSIRQLAEVLEDGYTQTGS